MNDLSAISGLRWESRWRLDNGRDSFVIPFGTTRPSTLVFHGEIRFQYGHYGIHLGQEDRLTFLGPSANEIAAHFIDCRQGSETYLQRLSMTFAPSTARTLCIPPGVAHAFDGLEFVHTINDYRLFLPDPEAWATGSTDWIMGNDIHNLPMQVTDSEIKGYVANPHEASDLFYQLVAAHQRDVLPKLEHEYPYTEDVAFGDGSRKKLLFRKRVEDPLSLDRLRWDPAVGIEGVGWR